MIQQPETHTVSETNSVADDCPLIPDKRYFKIGEVCEIAGVKQHVLRYWESEFKRIIKPQRASSKQRLYRRIDVENILKIKKLLKDDGFTIPGAKKALTRQKDANEEEVLKPKKDQKVFLAGLKSELTAILKLLK